MAVTRKILVAGAVAVAVTGAGVAPAFGVIDQKDFTRLNAAHAWPGAATAIDHVRKLGDLMDFFNALDRNPANNTNYQRFGRVGTVTSLTVLPKSYGDKTSVKIRVGYCEASYDADGNYKLGGTAITFVLDNDSAAFARTPWAGWDNGITLRDNGNPAKLAKVNPTNIKLGDRIGVEGTQNRGSGIAGLVVVKTLH